MIEGGWSRVWRSRWLGLALCIGPAAVLAACAGASDDADSGGDASAELSAVDPDDDTARPDDTPSAEAEAGGPSDAADVVDVDDVDDVADGQTAPTDDEPVISFASDVAPIVERTCARCHTATGPGTQHVVMDNAGMVAAVSGAIDIVTESGYMPPWPAGGDSIDFRHDWSLEEIERQTLAAWHAAGAPLDVDPATPIEPSERLTTIDDPDLVVAADGTYDGELGQPDEYRCFIFDPGVTERSFVRSLEFIPDQEMVVHHAVGSVVSAVDRDSVEALAAAEDDGQGGWTCFGFTPARSADLILGWAPGQAATVYPDGSGLLMDPGDFFVVQIHYHYEVEAPADRSELAIEWVDGAAVGETTPIDVGVYLAPAEIPCTTEETGPLCDRTAAKSAAVEKYGPQGVLADVLMAACGYSPADFAGMTDGIATAECIQPVNSRGRVLSLFGHQHELGKGFRMVLNPGRPDEQVLLDIPRWDFEWQLLYEPVDDVFFEPGDELLIECTWDRSLRDPTLEPAYVLWADGTDDEMCFAMATTVPA